MAVMMVPVLMTMVVAAAAVLVVVMVVRVPLPVVMIAVIVPAAGAALGIGRSVLEPVKRHVPAYFEGLAQVEGEELLATALLGLLVEAGRHVLAVVGELQGIEAPEGLGHGEDVPDEALHEAKALGQAPLPGLRFGHVHGVEEGRGHALGRNGRTLAIVDKVGEEQALEEAAHLARKIHEVDGAAEDDAVGAGELLEHRAELVPGAAAPVGGAVLLLAGKAAPAARVVQPVEVDDFGFRAGAGVLHALHGPLEQARRAPLGTGAAVDAVYLHERSLLHAGKAEAPCP